MTVIYNSEHLSNLDVSFMNNLTQITLPAEWHSQDAILLAWPHKNTDWQPWLSEVETLYFELSTAISQYQTVLISCDPVINLTTLIQRLTVSGARLDNIQLVDIPTNDTWARDHGAITVFQTTEKNQIVQPLDFQFNAWGGKFESDLDNQITANLVHTGKLKAADKIDLILEGGSIESDGHGTILTTEICLLNENRNNQLTKSQIETSLKEHLGAKRILWLTQGHLPGDDTDAHIDTLARFCDAHTIAYVQCSDKNNDLYAPLKTMEDELRSFTDFEGNPYTLIPLPMCDEVRNKNNDLLPATYANFLITNEQVLVPTYDCKQDQNALDIFTKTFQNKTIKPINCRVLIEQFGSLHCITMQLPKGALL
jgi:agmatine deiminase